VSPNLSMKNFNYSLSFTKLSIICILSLSSDFSNYITIFCEALLLVKFNSKRCLIFGTSSSTFSSSNISSYSFFLPFLSFEDFEDLLIGCASLTILCSSSLLSIAAKSSPSISKRTALFTYSLFSS